MSTESAIPSEASGRRRKSIDWPIECRRRCGRSTGDCEPRTASYRRPSVPSAARDRRRETRSQDRMRERERPSKQVPRPRIATSRHKYRERMRARVWDSFPHVPSIKYHVNVIKCLILECDDENESETGDEKYNVQQSCLRITPLWL